MCVGDMHMSLSGSLLIFQLLKDGKANEIAHFDMISKLFF